MSSGNLFDVESSDDEDIDTSKKDETTIPNGSNANNGNGNEENSEPKKTNTALFGDDDDSDSSDGDTNNKNNDAMIVDRNDDKNDDDVNGEDSTAAKQQKPTTSELFGDDSDDDDDDDDGDAEGEAKLDDVVGSDAPVSKTPENKPIMTEDDALVGNKSNIVIAKPPEKATVLEIPHPNENVSLHMTKLPNLVAIQPNAFEEDLYLEKEEEEQYKGYVHNMVRWRYKRDAAGKIERDTNGQLLRESNTRIVKWSDGSFTLHIGNESFDVQTNDSSVSGFAGLNGYVYVSQKATFSNQGEEEDNPGGTVLECMGAVSSRFTPKPSSLQSESHKSLTVAVRQRTIKKARIAEYVTEEDPEKAKAMRIRNKEDLEKATARKSSSYRGGSSRYRRPAMSRGYLEEEEDGDYDTTNIRALKKGNMDDDMDDYGEESDDDDDGYDNTFRRKRSRKQNDSDEEEELVFDEESDEEEGTLIKAHASSRRKAQAVVDDDDDE